MILLFIIFVSYIILKTIFVETKQDICILKDISKNTNKECWKLFGGLIVGTELVALTVLAYIITGSLTAFLLLPILGLIYSICHDCGMSYRLTGGLFHLGKGRWDTKIAQIFQNGILWLIFKLVWLTIISGYYFTLIKEI